MQFFTILACSFRRLFSSTSVFLSLRIFSRSSIAEKRIRYFVTSKLQIKEFGHTIKERKLYETSDCLTRDTLNFSVFRKRPRTVFSTTFLYDFSRKTFFILYFIN